MSSTRSAVVARVDAVSIGELRRPLLPRVVAKHPVAGAPSGKPTFPGENAPSGEPTSRPRRTGGACRGWALVGARARARPSKDADGTGCCASRALGIRNLVTGWMFGAARIYGP